MACRIGMATNPRERVQHWKRVEGHTRASILATGLIYSQALDCEKREAQSRGCRHHGGGNNPVQSVSTRVGEKCGLGATRE